MKNAVACLALASLFALVACGGSSTSGGAAGSPGAAPTVQASAAAGTPDSSAAAASQAPGGTDTPEPTPTPNANLLSYQNGARVVSYPAQMSSDPDEVAIGSISLPDGATGPFVFIYELPTTEHIDSFTPSFDALDTSPKRTATIAVSTTSATDGFHDVGSAGPSDAESAPVIKAGVDARWVRITWNSPDARKWEGISAAGTMPGPRAGSNVSRYFVEHDHPYKAGADDGADTSDDPYRVRATVVGDGMTLVHCYVDKGGATSTGTIENGRVYTFTYDNNPGRLVINDEGTQMVGTYASGPLHYMVSHEDPKFCDAGPPVGHGSNRLVVLDTTGQSDPYPMGDDWTKQAAPYTFVRMPGGLVTPADLANANMVILNGICDSSAYLSPAQGKMLNDFVAAGHKLAIYNADMCGGETRYPFLPYEFVTSNPGAGGAHGDRLIEVESDDLGSLDKTDTKRYLNAGAYAAELANQIGDANTVTTKDEHWCGHLFGTNAKHVNGFMQMYAPYGKGVFIFGGFDLDDNGLPEYQKMRDLELGMTMPADLPCTVKVSLAFVLQPDREGSFTAGKTQSLPFDMEVLANQGWKGHIDVTTQGDFPTVVTPSSFDIDGTTQPLHLAVNVPASTKAGTYAVTVNASDATGHTSQAVIQFNGEAPLKAIPKKQKRIRLYGIHFDYNSAKIQPRSEPVIKEIADLMKGDRTLRFQVEGHTDSDGGGPYNLKLSQARAQSVVADLIHRYHIAASRLMPKGFGLTKPVASNNTAGGKALNRRVELLRL